MFKEEDTIYIVPGFVGAHPNLFLEIDYKDLRHFVDEYKNISSFEQYNTLVSRYGVRRTNPEFWKISDWFNKKNHYENKE